MDGYKQIPGGTRSEKMPPAQDRPHIPILAQAILDTVQPYAREHGLDFASVMSAIGTAAGAMTARAYKDPAIVDNVCARLSVAAQEFAKVLIEQDIRSGRRPMRDKER